MYRSDVYRLIFNLFDLWALSETQRLEMLGISDKNIKSFNDYQSGLPVEESLEVAEREAHLLAIHEYLRLLFPNQREPAYQWMNQKSKLFNGAPAAFAALNGLRGLKEIRIYLSNICHN